ncbi:methyl-accepting chemotaxis protein [Candidatus Synechococcus calcipolaris G9]|uniref:Methyl-accepting chemotaxis protein n=1 Tax=Candidatus Synechococcus calcipolaris G9 TaxID=1497997 RepID=A0ABT6F207_9SYNE|nr:methyl-accepting chemotaxis protein [Candidatus Synechococcus calcipolaris]MDG2991874.1 methyl-accepting chemotaxis protein [Candidatus Synechococcus calcipolaris G9]
MTRTQPNPNPSKKGATAPIQPPVLPDSVLNAHPEVTNGANGHGSNGVSSQAPGTTDIQPSPLAEKPSPPRARLQAKLLATALALGVIPVVAVGGVAYWSMEQSVARARSQQGENPAAEIYLRQRVNDLQHLQWVVVGGTLITALGVGAIAAYLIKRSLRPLIAANETVEKLSQGDFSARLSVTGEDEVAHLGQNINHMAIQIQGILSKQSREAYLGKCQSQMTLRIAEQETPTDILDTAVTEIRQVLQSDRVIVYEFDTNWAGKVVAESVVDGWPKALEQTIDDPCFRKNWIKAYEKGRVQATADIYQANLNDCYLKQLEPLGVKANLVAPLVVDQKLVALLIAHQCSGPRQWQTAEVSFFTQMATQVGLALVRANLLARTEAANTQQALEAQRAKFLRDLTLRLSQFKSTSEILAQGVADIRQILQSDRVIVYEFDPNWVGTVVAESVGEGWPKALEQTIDDPCFRKNWIKAYEKGRVQATADIDAANLNECYLGQLKPLGVKANLVAPMLVEQKLVALLIAHQCDAPRQWQQSEIDFFTQLATQLGLVIERANFLRETEAARQKAETLAADRQRQTEDIQLQLINLLSEVEEASQGNLMVRADITAGEIGTVADIFNSLIESLREVVIQVKTATSQVNASLSEDETAMGQLAKESLRQAKKINRMLEAIEEMSASIESVTHSANQAAEVARHASETAQTSGETMDETVQSIMHLRETVAETAKKVKRLGESSQQISKVISLINQIALQTNLLAINASIEAARAGEEGRGFAVVAEEVGELAARSAAATKEIEQIVEAIQQETNEVVAAMETGTSQVVEGTRLVETAKKNLEEIVEVSHHIDELVQSISESTVSQSHTSNTVNTLMKDIAKVSEGMSATSQHISDSLQETVAVAQTLQASVDTFKVSAEG